MNLLFLDQFSDIGGAQRCLLDLLPGVQERGWTAHVALPGEGRLTAALAKAGIDAHPIRCGPYGFGSKSPADFVRFLADFPRLARRIAALAARLAPDVVYVNGPRLLPAAAWAARRHGFPLLYHCHSRLSRRYAAILGGNALRLAHAETIACCRYAGEPLGRYVPAARLHIVHNGVPAATATRRRGAPPVAVGIVGRIAPEKGQAEFLEAARILAASGNSAEFVVCGAPVFSSATYFDRVRRQAQGLRVRFTGWHDDVAGVLAGLDVLVVPSNADEPGAPRVILEAYAAGVPVVAFPSGGIPEVVDNGRTGALVAERTPAALARAIGELIANPGLRGSMSENARAAWRERYTVERYRNDVLNVLEQIQPKSSAAPSATQAAATSTGGYPNRA